jgi:hypothetical protein
MPEISGREGNPASAIRTQYQHLMSIKDAQTLKEEALKLAVKGISPKNRLKFERAVMGESSLSRLQGYLTNFILASDGLRVI